MAATMEYEGRNLKKAIQNASRKLEIDADDLKYDILSHGSSGIFGLVGTKKARIRVIPPENQTSSPEDPENQEISSADETMAKPDNEKDHSDITRRNNDLESHDTRPTEIKTKIGLDLVDADSIDDSEAMGREALQTIVDAVTSGAEIESRIAKGQIDFDVKGGNTAIVIGKRGQTLEAIQYIVEKIVNKQRHERVRVHIDAGDYMRKRRQNLEQIASRVANKAKRMRRPASLGQLNPHDRRIVHMALRRDDEVWTKSLGEGHIRKLVVYPKRRTNQEPGRKTR